MTKTPNSSSGQNETLNTAVSQALSSLDRLDFQAFTLQLRSIGEEIGRTYGVHSVKQLQQNNLALDDISVSKVSEMSAAKMQELHNFAMLYLANWERSVEAKDQEEAFKAKAIELAQLAREANKSAEENATMESLKAELKKLNDQLNNEIESVSKNHLSMKDRHHIKLGLTTVLGYFKAMETANGYTYENQAADSILKEADEKIRGAIADYKTTRGKAISGVSTILGGVTALAFGPIEGGTAVFLLGVGLLGLLGIPLAGPALFILLGVTVACVAAPAFYTNYVSTRDDVEGVLGGFFGREIFKNFLEYKIKLKSTVRAGLDKDGKEIVITREITEKRKFSAGQRAAMFLFTLLFAIPTGVGIAALGYTSTLLIPGIIAMFGLAVPLAIFPPVAIAIAALVAVTMIAFFVSGFVGLLTDYVRYKEQINFENQFVNENEKKKISALEFLLGKKNIDLISNSIDSRFEKGSLPNKIAKVAAYTLTVVIFAISIAGLAFAAKAGAMSLAAMFHKVAKVPVALSIGLGIAMGGVCSFVGRAFKTTQTSVALVSNLVGLTSKSQDKPKVNAKQVLLAFYEGVLEFSFYFFGFTKSQAPGHSGILSSSSTVVSGFEAGASSVRTVGMAANGAFSSNQSSGGDATVQVTRRLDAVKNIGLPVVEPVAVVSESKKEEQETKAEEQETKADIQQTTEKRVGVKDVIKHSMLFSVSTKDRVNTDNLSNIGRVIR